MKYSIYFVVAVVLFGFQAVPASAQWAPEGYSTGWLNYATDYLGASTKCAANEGEWDFVLQEYNSHTALANPANLRIETVIYSDITESSRVGSVSYGQSAVESVCYDPQYESVWVRVRDNGSLYYGYEPVGFSGYRMASLRGRYLRGTIHLQRKSAPAPVAETLAPLNDFYRNDTPSFSMQANQATTLYGASYNTRFWAWTWRIGGGRGPSNAFSGGNDLGVKTVSLGNFGDGRFVWRFATRRNADQVVNQFNYDASCGGGQQRADVALKEVAADQLIDMGGMSGTVEVVDDGVVVATRTFAPGAAISPSFCILPNQQNIRIRLAASASANYLNDAGDTITMSVGLVQNASGQNYHRFSAAVPERQSVLSSTVNVTSGGAMQTLMLSNFYYTHNNMPEMGLSSAAPFVVDTTAPESNVSATGNIVGSTVVMNVQNTVRDVTSGMRNTTVVIDAVTAGALEGSVTHNFTVGAGVVGGPVSTQAVTLPLTVTPGATYQYYAVTRDVAGNITQTAPQTIVMPQLPPDVNANIFSVTDPCESDEISLVTGDCPPIGVALRIGNTGTRVVSGSSVPYQIEYRLYGESVWRAGPAGTWTTGIAPTTGVTAPINLTLSGIAYGNHQMRARVNYPVNNALNETDMTDNISGTVNMSIAPEPAAITIDSNQQVVRYGGSAQITWRVSAPYALTCRVTGPGVARTFTHDPGVTDISANPVSSAALTSTQQFTITCSSGPIGGFTVGDVSSTQTVEVIPRAAEV